MRLIILIFTFLYSSVKTEEMHLSTLLTINAGLQVAACVAWNHSDHTFFRIPVPGTSKKIPITSQLLGCFISAGAGCMRYKTTQNFIPVYELPFLLALATATHAGCSLLKKMHLSENPTVAEKKSAQFSLSRPLLHAIGLFLPTSLWYDSPVKQFIKEHQRAIWYYRLYQ